MQTATDYRAVLGFISDQVGSIIDVAAQEGRIIRLIHKAAGDVLNTKLLERKVETVSVIGGRAKLPCDLIRILRVTDIRDNVLKGWDRVHASEYIIAPILQGNIRVYYLALPTVEVEGNVVPLLHKDMIDYCGYYAITVLLREKWLVGELPSDRFAYFEQQLEGAHVRARGVHFDNTSIDEVERALYMMRFGSFVGRGR